MHRELRRAVSHIVDRIWGNPAPAAPIDVALGIETSRRVSSSRLASGHAADKYIIGYVGAAPSLIRKCLSLIPDAERARFIDLGCGKGRALIVAAEFPFSQIVGIELSPQLCDIARQNVAKLTPKARYADRIAIVRSDAAAPDLASGAVVLFLYNPFRRPLVEKLAEHLARQRLDSPSQKIWIIYYNPVCYEVFDRMPGFSRYFAARISFDVEERESAPTGNTFDSVVIYQSTNSPVAPALPGSGSRVKITIAHFGADVVEDGEPDP